MQTYTDVLQPFFLIVLASLCFAFLPTIQRDNITDRCLWEHAAARINAHPRLVSGSQGIGTEDDVLIEILASRTGEQIRNIVKEYKKGELVRWERERQRQIHVYSDFTTCTRTQRALTYTRSVKRNLTDFQCFYFLSRSCDVEYSRVCQCIVTSLLCCAKHLKLLFSL